MRCLVMRCLVPHADVLRPALPCVPHRLEAVFDELCATHGVQRLPVPGKHLHKLCSLVK